MKTILTPSHFGTITVPPDLLPRSGSIWLVRPHPSGAITLIPIATMADHPEIKHSDVTGQGRYEVEDDWESKGLRVLDPWTPSGEPISTVVDYSGHMPEDKE